MKAIIHIGTEKTGTTSIQEMLFQNMESLGKTGIAYLHGDGEIHFRELATYSMDIDADDDHLHHLGIQSKSRRIRWRRQFEQKFSRYIQSLDQSISTVIISSEHFHSRLKTVREVQNLYDLLQPHFDEIQIIVYLRRQDQVSVSLYGTWCRVGGTHTQIIDENISSDSTYFNYFKLAQRWSEVFSRENLFIRIYDKTVFYGGDLLKDFLFVVGITNLEGFVIPKRLNEKIPGNVQDVIVLFNSAFSYFGENGPSHFNNHLRNYIIQNLTQDYRGRENMPTRNEALAFYQKFVVSNMMLSRDFNLRPNLFSDDFSMYPVENQETPIAKEVIRDTFQLMAQYLNQYVLLSKEYLKDLEPERNPINTLQQIAAGFESDAPEIARLLNSQSQIHRPLGHVILEKCELFGRALMARWHTR